MSKGLKRTLVTVAVALMGMSAMAEAPVILEVPSPIVGGGEGTTPPNTFVYPDAINLSTYVTDDGPVADVVWSYEVVGTQIYSINGNAPIDSATEDPTDPAAVSKDLGTVRNGEEDPDADGNTITVRNVHLSPIGGPNVDPGAETGIISSETQVVTLYASDGTTFSEEGREVLFYTDNEGADRLSPESEIVYEANFINDDNGYTTYQVFNSATVSVGANGICIEVAATNTNMGSWVSQYAPFQMAANSVYRIRANMNGTQTTVGLVPLWDMIVQNYDNNNALAGANAYLADFFLLDNEGGAYGIGLAGGIDVAEFYFVPLPALFPSWNDPSTGAFIAGNEGRNDIQLIFRVLDAANTGYGGELDTGQLCISGLTVDRFDLINDVSVVGAPVMDLAVNQTNYRGYDLLSATNFNWSTPGQLTLGPADGNFELEITYLEPGDGDHPGTGGTGSGEDDFPIAWEADTIYMVEMDVSAPTAGDETDPVDVIQLCMDPPTWEDFVLNSVTRGGTGMHNIGMPKAGTPQTYVTFLSSDQVSKSLVPDFRRLRPRVQILNSPALVFDGRTQNTGDFTIHGITVSKVTIQK